MEKVSSSTSDKSCLDKIHKEKLIKQHQKGDSGMSALSCNGTIPFKSKSKKKKRKGLSESSHKKRKKHKADDDFTSTESMVPDHSSPHASNLSPRQETDLPGSSIPQSSNLVEPCSSLNIVDASYLASLKTAGLGDREDISLPSTKRGLDTEQDNICDIEDSDDESSQAVYGVLAKYGINTSNRYREMMRELKERGLKLNTGPWRQKEIDRLMLNWEVYLLSHPDIKEPLKFFTMYKYPKERRELQNLAKETNLYSTLCYKLKRNYNQVQLKAQSLFVDWKRGKHSDEEWDLIGKMRAEGKQWREIAVHIDRMPKRIGARYKTKVLDCHKQGAWSSKEDKRLLHLVKTIPTVYDDLNNKHCICWATVSKEMKNRNPYQCHQRYQNVLKWRERTGVQHRPEFSSQDKILLIEDVINENVQSDSDVDWVKLARKYYNVLDPSLLKSHWLNLRSLVPQYKIKTLDQITDYLLEHEMPKLQARVDKKINRLRKIKTEGIEAYDIISESDSSDTEHTI